MKSLKPLTSFATALAAALFTVGTATADMLIYENINVGRGEINGSPLFAQTATVAIEFDGGLTAFASDGHTAFDLGVLTSATYTFSGAGAFTVDAPQDNLYFGTSAFGWDLAFWDMINFDIFMASGTTAGSAGMSPLVGETMAQMFARLGDGSSISFVQDIPFQMLNPGIGGLNGGLDFVTDNIEGNAGSEVTLTYIPSPGAVAAFGLFGLFGSRRRRSA